MYTPDFRPKGSGQGRKIRWNPVTSLSPPATAMTCTAETALKITTKAPALTCKTTSYTQEYATEKQERELDSSERGLPVDSDGGNERYISLS